MVLPFEEVPFVPMDLVPLNRLHFSEFELRTTAKLSSGVYIEQGHGVIARITPCFENGKQGYISNLPGCFGFGSMELFTFKGKPSVADTRFLLYALASPTIRAELAGKMEGTTGRQRLSRSTLTAWELGIPSYADQLCSVRILDAIQAVRLARLREIELERERKAALMSHLFAYGTQNEPRRDTPLGPMPESWQVVGFEDCFDTVSGQVDPKIEPWASAIHVGPDSIESGTGRFLEMKTARELTLISGKYPFNEGHIFYSKIRPYLNKVGLPTFVGICSADMYALLAKVDCD